LLQTFLLIPKMRLDIYLADKGLADSRTDAKNFILAGKVSINGKVINKPAFSISGCEAIIIDKSGKKFVSRGGFKLEGALDVFDINPAGLIALDIGASSGGFTDCLLQRGASRVIAVDSGSGQMVSRLREDSRVTVIENFNARYMTSADFDINPEIAVMDVSFISAKLIMPAVYSVLTNNGIFVCLIKPQFEVGRSGLNKKGIVKNDVVRKKAVEDVLEFAKAIGFINLGLMESPILGGDGNAEYLAYFIKGKDNL